MGTTSKNSQTIHKRSLWLPSKQKKTFQAAAVPSPVQMGSATCDKGGVIVLNSEKHRKLLLAAGKISTTYRAEALKTATEALISEKKGVIEVWCS